MLLQHRPKLFKKNSKIIAPSDERLVGKENIESMQGTTQEEAVIMRELRRGSSDSVYRSSSDLQVHITDDDAASIVEAHKKAEMESAERQAKKSEHINLMTATLGHDQKQLLKSKRRRKAPKKTR